jgi:hypothetical protein
MIYNLREHVILLNIKHCLGINVLLHEILTHTFNNNLIFLLLHNHALDLFLIQKGHMGIKLSLSLLLVSLVFFSHLFHHIFLFLKQDHINGNDLSSLNRQLGIPLEKLQYLPLLQCSISHLLLRRLLEFLQDIILIVPLAIITNINLLAIPAP